MPEANQALYLKYRPSRFTEVIGQAPIIKTLTQALDRGRVSHAYLFTGPRGTGKTTTARLLAKGVNCEGLKKGEPDDTCNLCVAINAGSCMDVLEIDAASNRGIDEIRELRDKVHYAPSQAKRKVYIVDEAHMLTKEAFNALLKTLEEPPAHAMFILATTEPGKLPQTIVSRCQRFDFRPATPAIITGQLTEVAKSEGIKLDAEAGEMIARAARGSFRDGLSILDLLTSVADAKITGDLVREVLGLTNISAVAALERALVAGDKAKALTVIAEAGEQGVDPEALRLALVDYLRTLMRAKVGVAAPKQAVALAADWELTRLTQAIRGYLAIADLVQTAAPSELPLEIATLEQLDEAPPIKVPEKIRQDVAKAALKQAAGTATTVAKPAPAKDGAPEKQEETVATDATELWEQLLTATKNQYSLSVCLQKTRPGKLTEETFELKVQSDFFLRKLQEAKVKTQLHEHVHKIIGRELDLQFETIPAGEADAVADALQVFEGAKVE